MVGVTKFYKGSSAQRFNVRVSNAFLEYKTLLLSNIYITLSLYLKKCPGEIVPSEFLRQLNDRFFLLFSTLQFVKTQSTFVYTCHIQQNAVLIQISLNYMTDVVNAT